MRHKPTPEAKANVLKPNPQNHRVQKTVPHRATKLTANSKQDRLFAAFSPHAMYSSARTHLESFRKSFPDQDEATYRYIAARAAAYEIQYRQLREDTAAAKKRATRRLNDLARDPSLAILSPLHQRLGRGYEADQEYLMLEGQKICLDWMLMLCSNRRQLFRRGELSEIEEFLATEVMEMQSTENIYSAEKLTVMKLRDLWPTCYDDWERLMRLQLVWVTSRVAHGMETAAVNLKVDDLMKDMETLDLGKASEDDIGEEKHEKAMSLLQDLLDALHLETDTEEEKHEKAMSLVQDLLGALRLETEEEKHEKAMSSSQDLLGALHLETEEEKHEKAMSSLQDCLDALHLETEEEKHEKAMSLLQDLLGAFHLETSDLEKASEDDTEEEKHENSMIVHRMEESINDMETLALGKASEDETEKEKHKKAISSLQDRLAAFYLETEEEKYQKAISSLQDLLDALHLDTQEEKYEKAMSSLQDCLGDM